ncbi:MAG: hypothetical protein H7144_00445, partial [Burkholderiales bacterium]|nr:hypothetical protein [Phycisphaerae bacterium]
MATIDRFKCQSCGKTYAWKMELAGKKVRCKCGTPVLVPKPAVSETADDPSLDDLYALSGDDRPQAAVASNSIRCPSCQADVEAGTMICVSCGMDFKSGTRVLTVSGAGSPARAWAVGGAAARAP